MHVMRVCNKQNLKSDNPQKYPQKNHELLIILRRNVFLGKLSCDQHTHNLGKTIVTIRSNIVLFSVIYTLYAIQNSVMPQTLTSIKNMKIQMSSTINKNLVRLNLSKICQIIFV
jgi:hypothetical protein